MQENVFDNIVHKYKADDLKDKILKEKEWLYDDKGLGLMRIFQKIIKQKGSKLSIKQLENFNKGIELLRKTNYPDIDGTINYFFKNGVENEIFVLNENGDWSYINKVDTNYSQQTEILIYLLQRMIDSKNNYYSNLGNKIYENINNDVRKGLLFLKEKVDLLDLLSRINLNNFTDEIKSSSEWGEIAEEKISEYLISKGFKILYHGGNGDLIDMKFGCDMILYKEGYGHNGYITLQVKYSEPNQYQKNKYSGKINWLSTYKGGIKIVNMSTNEIINL